MLERGIDDIELVGTELGANREIASFLEVVT